MLASFPLPEQFTSNFFETFWYIFPTSNHIFLLIFINIICNFVSSQFTHSIFFYLLKHSGGWERSTMECDSVGAPTSMCCIFSLLPSSLSVSHSFLPLNCIFMYIFILSYLSPCIPPSLFSLFYSSLDIPDLGIQYNCQVHFTKLFRRHT